MIQHLLEQLVKIPSLTGQESRLAEFCEQYLQAAGFRTSRQYISTDRFNVLAERGEGNWSLLLYSHLDTIAPGPGWLQDPYSLRQDGDELQGLGVSDMKGGLAVILQAASEIVPSGYCLKIALTVDEETYSRGAYHFVNSQWAQDVAGVLVPELSTESQEEELGLGRRGHFSYDINVYGRKVHAAVHHLGVNAIEIAGKLILTLRQFPVLRTPDFGGEDLLIRSIRSEQPDLSVPDICSLLVSYFAHPGHTAEQILDELRHFIEPITRDFEISYTLRPTPMPSGYWTAPMHPFVRWVQQIATETWGQPLNEVYGLSVADENVLANRLAVPVLSLAPVGGRSHQPGEWVSLRSLNRTLELYKAILAEARGIA